MHIFSHSNVDVSSLLMGAHEELSSKTRMVVERELTIPRNFSEIQISPIP
jgi:hypothetical protein